MPRVDCGRTIAQPRDHRFRLAIAILACLIAAGCATTTTFLVVDATTDQSLAGVKVTRLEWTQRWVGDGFGWGKNLPDQNYVPVGITGPDGVLVSRTFWRPFIADVGVYMDTIGFDFEMSGYQQAAATVYVDKKRASVISPEPQRGSPPAAFNAADAHGIAVDPYSVIRIPMHPIKSE